MGSTVLTTRTARCEAVKDRRCMNCGRIIANPSTDIYSRRFCSVECKKDYCNF